MATSQVYVANGTYPPDWKEISRAIREDRAGNQCEWVEDGIRCARRHGEPIPGNEQRKTILTVAHLNHIASDCRPDNLAAWCQRHHLTYDAPMHAKHARETLAKAKRESGPRQLTLQEQISSANATIFALRMAVCARM